MPQTSSVMNKISQNSIVPFAAVGLLSTSVDLLIFNGFLHIGIEKHVAVALGFFSGLVVGYLLNSAFVFKVKRNAVQSLKYTVVSIGGFLLTEGIVSSLSGSLKIASPLEAKLIAVGVVFFWNYELSRAWAFK